MFGKKDSTEGADMEFFTVFDSKTKTYREPFPAPNAEVVKRDFLNAFRKPNAAEVNTYFINAEDYSLFKIGSFTFKTGALVGQNMEHIVNLHDLRALVEPRGIGPT